MQQVDSDLPLARMETLEHHVDRAIAERRFYMMLLGVFASVALALAAVGIFGVMSFLVAQRTREIGIRVALGAAGGAVVSLVMRQTLFLAAAGATLGTLAGLGLSGLMQTMLFDVKPTDPLTFAIVDVGLILVAALAAWVPMRRALQVDPTLALRAE
jgi:putative ABC transport system permease protein